MRLGLRTAIGLLFIVFNLNKAFAEVSTEAQITETLNSPIESRQTEPAQPTSPVNMADPNLAPQFEQVDGQFRTIILEPKIPSILTSERGDDPTCIVSSEGKCVLRAFYREIEFRASAAGRIMLAVGRRQAEEEDEGDEPAEEFVFIHEDLASRMERGEITDDEAQIIASEIKNLEGAYYEIPDIQVLLIDLGFPPETQFAVEDLRDLIRTHLQISIGVGPITAAYLCDRLGVQPIEEYIDITPHQVKPIRLVADFR